MGYKAYTKQDLADFTGRPAASFPDNFITKSALPQALLLFKIGTCLASPDDLNTDQQQLVDFAIVSFADAIHLAAPYQAAKANPFNSESIGSYSYSKAAGAVQRGEDTGVFWFDKAISELSVCDSYASDFIGGGIEIFEHDGLTYGGSLGGQTGNVRFLSPQDLDASRGFGHDPSFHFGW